MALTEEQKQQVHAIICDGSMTQWYPIQELTTVATWICNDPTEETVKKAQDHLAEFPYYRLGQTQMHPTRSAIGMGSNDVRLALSKIRELLKLYPWNEEEDAEESGD